jgi:hypothetical protein
LKNKKDIFSLNDLLKEVSDFNKSKIEDFIRAKLKEQRKLCLDNIVYGVEDDNDLESDMYAVRESSILNAPEPIL